MTDLTEYFLLPVPVSAAAWKRFQLEPLLAADLPPESYYRMQLVAERMQPQPGRGSVAAGQLQLLGLLCRIFRQFCSTALHELGPVQLQRFDRQLQTCVELYPPEAVLRGESPQDYLQGPKADVNRRLTLAELFIIALQCDNPAATDMRALFADDELDKRCSYRRLLHRLDRDHLPGVPGLSGGESLYDTLLKPILAAPGSLDAQLRWITDHWAEFLPAELLIEIPATLSLAAGEGDRPTGEPGPPLPPGGGDDAEPEAFSRDAGWMAEVVLIAKSTNVWLHQLSQRYETEIGRLDQIPDAELDLLADSGFNALWLIGLWERSSASSQLKRLRGNQDAMASAYALYDYSIAWDLGGEEAFWQLSERCTARGIRLCGDVVPNHTGLYSRWIKEHPDWYIQLDHAPYAAYRFNGPDLSADSELELTIDDGYFDHSDAAVVFRHHDRRSGRTRFIYHGNDGTHMPWNDTAQLNYLLPEVREAMIQTIIAVAKRFPLIRFDAAMTLAKKHFQRLWYPIPGGGAGVPSRALHALPKEEFDRLFPTEFWREVVDRVAREVPDTLLLAEAFWLLEGYFVRTLGMHRVYNSAFMNMLKREDNAKYRQVIKETLEFNPQILQRFVNFMNNPDEATAVEQFGKGDKYFGVTVLLATLPGLPLFGHGQIEGLREKYGMEYSRPQLDEEIDRAFLEHHHSQVFPLLRRRSLFNDAEHFVLYDFFADDSVNEDVFAFSNCHDSQRALVIYNNSPAETEGWIRVSAAKRIGGEDGVLGQTGLGAALSLQDDEAVFYRCRELRSCAEMLLQGADLHRRGLGLRLGPYQYQVLIDFEEQVDSDGCLQQIWQQLGHVTCHDLDRRILMIRHADLVEPWWQLRRALADSSAAEAVPPERTMAPFYRELTKLGPGQRSPSDAARAAGDRLQAWSRLGQELSPPAAEERDILLPWLLWSAAIDPASEVENIAGFGHLLVNLSNDSCDQDETARLRLAALLLRLTHSDPQELHDHFKQVLLNDPEILDWLERNRWQGIDYLNRERLERLLFWLPRCCRLQAVDVEECDKSALQRIDQACTRMLEEAEACGYRLEILTQLS